jgi:hypothetical protein
MQPQSQFAGTMYSMSNPQQPHAHSPMYMTNASPANNIMSSYVYPSFTSAPFQQHQIPHAPTAAGAVARAPLSTSIATTAATAAAVAQSSSSDTVMQTVESATLAKIDGKPEVYDASNFMLIGLPGSTIRVPARLVTSIHLQHDEQPGTAAAALAEAPSQNPSPDPSQNPNPNPSPSPSPSPDPDPDPDPNPNPNPNPSTSPSAPPLPSPSDSDSLAHQSNFVYGKAPRARRTRTGATPSLTDPVARATLVGFNDKNRPFTDSECWEQLQSIHARWRKERLQWLQHLSAVVATGQSGDRLSTLWHGGEFDRTVFVRHVHADCIPSDHHCHHTHAEASGGYACLLFRRVGGRHRSYADYRTSPINCPALEVLVSHLAPAGSMARCSRCRRSSNGGLVLPVDSVAAAAEYLRKIASYIPYMFADDGQRLFSNFFRVIAVRSPSADSASSKQTKHNKVQSVKFNGSKKNRMVMEAQLCTATNTTRTAVICRMPIGFWGRLASWAGFNIHMKPGGGRLKKRYPQVRVVPFDRPFRKNAPAVFADAFTEPVPRELDRHMHVPTIGALARQLDEKERCGVLLRCFNYALLPNVERRKVPDLAQTTHPSMPVVGADNEIAHQNYVTARAIDYTGISSRTVKGKLAKTVNTLSPFGVSQHVVFADYVHGLKGHEVIVPAKTTVENVNCPEMRQYFIDAASKFYDAGIPDDANEPNDTDNSIGANQLS